MGNPLAPQNYRNIRKKYKSEIIKAKAEYNDDIIKNANNKNAAIWKIIKQNSVDKKHYEKIEILPDILNNHFVNLVSTNNIPLDISSISTQSKLSNFDRLNNVIRSQLQFEETTPASIVLIVKNLKCSRSEDITGLSSYLLKHIIDILHVPLCQLINISIRNGKFPEILKETVIIPIYKKGNKRDPENYRPIALVPILSKVYEHVINSQFCVYLEKYKIISNQQYGFRKGLGTLDAVEKVVSEIHNNFERKKLTSVLLLDLSKAFDTISHTILIKKLQAYGVLGKELDVFKSYLFNRRQVVKVSGVLSGVLSVNRGVPQGSILGPLLFIIYINDLQNVLEVPPILYADDTTIISSNKSLTTLQSNIQEELLTAKSWFNQNQLRLNESKTENIIFGLSSKYVSLDNTKYVKLLGMCLDCNLSWNVHIDSVIKKLAMSVFIIRRLRYSVSRDYLKLAYFAFFHSFVTYGILFWGSSPRRNEVFLWQKRAIRLLSGLSFRDSCRGYFKQNNILTLPCLFVFHSILFIKSHIRDFIKGSMLHSHETRNNQLLLIPRTRLSKLTKSYKIQGLKFYNLLPSDVKNYSYPKFKSAIKNLLIQSEGYSLEEIEQYLIQLNC